MKYKFLNHPADVKFQAFGKDVEEMFTNSALALKEAVVEKLDVKSVEKKKIKVSAKDFESLLYIFLEEFLYYLDAEDFLFSEIKEIKVDEEKFEIDALILGDKAENYKFTNEVKAITYSEMFVKKEKDKWVCQVVLDV